MASRGSPGERSRKRRTPPATPAAARRGKRPTWGTGKGGGSPGDPGGGEEGQEAHVGGENGAAHGKTIVAQGVPPGWRVRLKRDPLLRSWFDGPACRPGGGPPARGG